MSPDVSIVISLASFIISGYVLWITQLAKYRLDVTTTARVELTSNPQSPGARQAGIKLQLLFTNKGAHLGYVHDVALVVRRKGSANNETIVLRSLYESLDETLNLTDQLPPPKLVVFSSFPIPPSETISKKVVFVPLEPQAEFRFSQGVYAITPYTKGLKNKEKWHKWNALEVSVEAEDVQVLNQAVATPTPGGGQFVRWLLHSKPTSYADNALKDLVKQIKNK